MRWECPDVDDNRAHHRAMTLAAVRDGQRLTLRGRPETLPVSRPFQGLFKPQ